MNGIQKSLCLFLLFAGLGTCTRAQTLPSRELDDLNWMEFSEIVPAKVKTVLLTTGTVEAHGVVNSGADAGWCGAVSPPK
jgi:hypothetical protein